MISRLIPFLWYGAGSICFLVGTIVSIVQIMNAE